MEHLVIALIVSDILLAALLLRYMIVRRGMKKVSREFHDSIQNKQGEQHVFCPVPDKILEELCAACNQYIREYHQERYRHKKEILDIRREMTNLSHDLRTPITSIIGYVEWMKENTETQDQKEDMEVIKRKALDLNALIEQLYEFVRLENMDIAVTEQQIDIFRLFKEHLLSFYPDFEAKGIDLTVSLPKQKEALWIQGDENGILRVFQNLTANTIKYCQGYSYISIYKDIESNAVRVIYQSARGNLSNYDVQHLFDRFYQKDEARTPASGSGLGLAIARLYVEQMKGTISAWTDDKDLYIGTSFLLTEKNKMT